MVDTETIYKRFGDYQREIYLRVKYMVDNYYKDSDRNINISLSLDEIPINREKYSNNFNGNREIIILNSKIKIYFNIAISSPIIDNNKIIKELVAAITPAINYVNSRCEKEGE